MKKTVLRYGLLACLTMVILFVLEWIIFRGETNYAAQEVVGYASIVISVLFVFFGIKHYRDRQNGGQLTFGRGMKVGTLIVLLPSITFGLFNVVYILFIDPNFLDKYYQYQVDQLNKGMSSAEFQAAKAAIESEKAMFASPAVQFFVMALTVFVIGLIVTVISSLMLKRSQK